MASADTEPFELTQELLMDMQIDDFFEQTAESSQPSTGTQHCTPHCPQSALYSIEDPAAASMESLEHSPRPQSWICISMSNSCVNSKGSMAAAAMGVPGIKVSPVHAAVSHIRLRRKR
jgi:hypothetical protein